MHLNSLLVSASNFASLHSDGLVVSKLPIVYTCVLSHVWLFVNPWTIACPAPLSMGFSRHKYWSEVPFPPPGDFSNPGIEPTSPCLLHGQADSLPLAPPREPKPHLLPNTHAAHVSPSVLRGEEEGQCRWWGKWSRKTDRTEVNKKESHIRKRWMERIMWRTDGSNPSPKDWIGTQTSVTGACDLITVLFSLYI